MRSIGFVGAGSMGSRMVMRLLRAGHRVCVCDKSPDATMPLREAGATVGSPAECAESDVTVVMLADAGQVEEAVFGTNGLQLGLSGKPAKLLVLMSTLLPATCIDIQERLGRERARIVDAPVSGGPFSASEGTLAIMAGGETEDVDELRDLFEVFGSKTFKCGPLGTGQVAKIINNMIGIASIYGGAEAFALASRSGLSLEVLGPILEASSGRNYFSRDVGLTRGNFADWSESAAVFASLIKIVTKDLSLAQRMSRDADLPTPVLDGLLATLQALPAETRDSWRAF